MWRCGRQVDGKGVGPMRVWPGGLAMGRTLGDHAGGAAVLCEPEIRQARPYVMQSRAACMMHACNHVPSQDAGRSSASICVEGMAVVSNLGG